MCQARQFVLVTVAIAILLAGSIANAQGPVTLQEQLAAQYKLVKMGSDSGGVAVVEPGTLLAVQKGGVLSVPWKAMALCPARFQDNNLHPSAGMCAAMVKSVSRYFQKGDKVYPTKIEVNSDKAKISFTVVACDACNGVNPPSSMKGEVVFQFAKGYLEKATSEKWKTRSVRYFPLPARSNRAKAISNSREVNNKPRSRNNNRRSRRRFNWE